MYVPYILGNIACFEEEIDYLGDDLFSGLDYFDKHPKYKNVATPEACQVLCQMNAECKYWTYGHIDYPDWYAGYWFLKNAKSNIQSKKGLTSGPRNCQGT